MSINEKVTTIQDYCLSKGITDFAVGGIDKKGETFSWSPVCSDETLAELDKDVGRKFTGIKGSYTLTSDRKYGLQFTLRPIEKVALM